MSTKVIHFYSYKGGVGKSLAVANFANLLARLGYCCAVIDTDFNAPTLHDKFEGFDGLSGKYLGLTLGTAEREALGRTDGSSEHIGGLVGYFGEAMRESLDSTRPTFRPVLPLKAFVREISGEDPGISASSPDSPSRGKIHFLPAGDFKKLEYVKVANSVAMHALFRDSHDQSDPQESQWSLERDTFMRSVRGQIEALEPAPDFILVDSPAGAIMQSSCMVRLWSDAMVIFFSNNSSSLNNLSLTLRKIHDAYNKRLIDNSRSFAHFAVPVVSRVPDEFTGLRVADEIKRVFDVLGLSTNSLFKLRADRVVEARERTFIPLRGAVTRRPLTKDYVDLFAHLINPDNPSQSIKTSIGLTAGLDEERTYTYLVDQGELVNPDDNKRNVAFKLTTFQALLGGLLGDPSGQSPATPRDGTAQVSRLRHAGRRCGASFGEALCNDWGGMARLDGSLYRGVQGDIQAWCNFDSRSGFGLFQLNPSPGWRHSGNFNYSRFVITLRNNFLVTQDQDPDAYRFCEWMSGYIEGVLSSLFPSTETFTVMHKIGDRATGTSHFDVRVVSQDNARPEVSI